MLINTYNPVGIYLLKVNNRNSRTRCEICSNLRIKIPERRQWRHSGIFIVKFEHILHFEHEITGWEVSSLMRTFLFSLFVPMSSRPYSILAVSTRSIFPFLLYFHYDKLYNLMNTDRLVLSLIFQNTPYYFYIITWMKNMSNFQIAKVQC